MNRERVFFDGATGTRLAGLLDLPETGEPRAVALFAHCFTCGKNAAAAISIARALVHRQIAVLRFDCTGIGASGGDFADTTFGTDIGDLVCAAAHLRTVLAPPDLLIGHSLGGAAVLAGAGLIPEVRAVATIGAPAEPRHIEHLFSAESEVIEVLGESMVSVGGREIRIRREFVEDLRQQNQPARIARLRRALLILHSPQDSIVGVDNARQIYDSAAHPKSFVCLDGADHLLTDRADATYCAQILATWAGRYIAADLPSA
ncbi:alpha/beta hydrolase family protein [Nocardia rhamnosiphila]|uniref:alpha/beta hydrolase family protein n=1 Tax=Nocardia rhamnosiphila TaxID=426716 RepID=UPI0004C45F45|nr:alpha/beta fold hydrolase [Nocardia rhamnosiphila]